jgi:hypothetical protein
MATRFLDKFGLEHFYNLIKTNNIDAKKLNGQTAAEIIEKIYPVGAIYISATQVNPATLFGGRWERIEDTFLYARGNGVQYWFALQGKDADDDYLDQTIPVYMWKRTS